MNFVNPNAVDGENPYRVDCGVGLYAYALLDVYKCPVIKEMQNKNISNRVVHHTGNEIFVFQVDDNVKQVFDKMALKQMCKNCQYKQRLR